MRLEKKRRKSRTQISHKLIMIMFSREKEKSTSSKKKEMCLFFGERERTTKFFRSS
jgi:hypothetical protein